MFSLFLILLALAHNAQALYQLKTSVGTTPYCLSSTSSQGQNLAQLTSDLTNCASINAVVLGNSLVAQTLGNLQCSSTAPCYWNVPIIIGYNVNFANALNGVGQPSGLYQLNSAVDPTNFNAATRCLYTSGSAPYQLVMGIPQTNALNGVNTCLEFSAVTITPPTSTVPVNPITSIKPVQPTTNAGVVSVSASISASPFTASPAPALSVTASTTSSTLTTSPTSAAYGSQITLFMILVIGLLFIF